jgi:hypothetical protein
MQSLFQLDHTVPEAVLARLYEDLGETTKRRGTQKSPQPNRPTPSRTRRPTTFGQTREALSYVLGDVERVLVPAHYNYQVRLQAFLAKRGLQAEWERDFVDVRFTLDDRVFIGEIKVTFYLTLDEAFRTALGQLLFYGHVLFDSSPSLIMLLDRAPETKRLALATKLDVSVVVERASGVFEFLSPAVARVLERAFPRPTASSP